MQGQEAVSEAWVGLVPSRQSKYLLRSKLSQPMLGLRGTQSGQWETRSLCSGEEAGLAHRKLGLAGHPIDGDRAPWQPVWSYLSPCLAEIQVL